MNIAEVYDQFKKYDVFKASLGELTVLETFPNGEVDTLIGEKQFHFYSEAVLSLVKLFMPLKRFGASNPSRFVTFFSKPGSKRIARKSSSSTRMELGTFSTLILVKVPLLSMGFSKPSQRNSLKPSTSIESSFNPLPSIFTLKTSHSRCLRRSRAEFSNSR